MKCPICGCKMKEEFMCPYCKITGEQVKNASNKKAKELIKQKQTKDVFNSTYMPKDINRTRLMLITLFGGAFGIHQFYVGKFKMGLFYLFSFFYAIIFYILSTMIFKTNIILKYFLDVGYILYGITLLLWLSDFFKVCFKKFSMPVVLGENERNKRRDK